MVDFQIRKGQTLTLDIGVVNIGDQEGTQTIELKRGGTVIDSQDVTLGAAKESTTQLSFDSAGLSTGDYTLTAASADDSDPTTVTVAAEADSQFDVTITDTTSPVVEGDRVFVSADVTNSGDELDAQPISLSIDSGIGTVATSRTLPVASGETKSISLDWETELGDEGDYTATVATDDDSDTASIDVDLNPKNTTGISEQWSTSIKGDVDAIAVSDSQVFVADDSDDLTAYSLSDGSQNWKITSGDVIFARYSDGLFTMNKEPNDNNSVSNRDESSGTAQWTTIDDSILSMDAGGYVAYGYRSGVDILDVGSGAQLTSFSDGTDPGVERIIVGGNKIYFATVDRAQRTDVEKSTDKNGNTTYSTSTVWQDEDVIVGNNIQDVALGGGGFYISSQDKISRIDAKGGRTTIREIKDNGFVSGLAYNNAVYAHVDDNGTGEVHSINLDGTKNWVATDVPESPDSISIVDNSIILAGGGSVARYDLDS